MENNMQPNMQTNPSTPPMNTMPTMGAAPKSGVGSIIATIVIIAIIILGGLYFWGKRIETERANQAAVESAGTTTDETAAVNQATQTETVSQDDSLNTIESETKTTQTTNLAPVVQ